ncbi:LysE family translocator [Halarcobacter ebronensis]|uniref:Lysine transporter LysE n=1 Tax=Halarcobacter ebronensis TaxID=1462615 RepID=A0A4Q1AYH9_9BACT|nr:LysE family translocator [Halarcobacter ebronensis]QKF80640.1 transporter, LysE family [Halarcobacter ebronensis]RXK08441.1 lysine transporter LysE [Halarcobacter ebronensis]
MESFYSFTLLFSILTFTLTATTTPGPNNIMLLSSGLTFGYKKTTPHILGIVLGFTIMILLVGIGLGVAFEKFPFILKILKIVGILYLCWMAYKIATSTGNIKIKEEGKPFTFIQAALFQWVNPKAWIMSITAISIFVSSKQNNIEQVFVIALIFCISASISCNAWALGGVVLKRFIKNKNNIKLFNIVMAFLLITSIIPFIFD